ncbi:MAG TPA: hypothetical protein VL360_04500 [Gammaproteobacteria bacterium]|jgi:opacity protein-like surface antigen|nr:hypothetical protein [Gammaproteobacteria bacterium]
MKRTLSAVILCCVCTFSWAYQLNVDTYQRNLYFNAGGGYSLNRVEGDSHLGAGMGWPADHYSVTGISDTPFIMGGFGYMWDRSNTWLPSQSLGVRFMLTQAAKITGYIDQYTLPEFRNYIYSYDVSLFNILGIYKLDIVSFNNFMPFVTIGAGLSTANMSSYTEMAPSNVTPRVNPQFNDNMSFNLAYLVGAGIDWAMRDDVWVNLEFDYANYGMVYTGKGENYTSQTGNFNNEWLKNKLAATSIFLGLTFYPA